MESKRIAIYASVSTDTQTTANQVQELKEVARRNGWIVVQVYKDENVSGAAAKEKRPAFFKLLRGAFAKEFDLIAAWSVH